MKAGEKERRPGHYWAWGILVGDKVLRRTTLRVHRIYGRGPLESVETSEELAVSLMTCERCGVLAAEWTVINRVEESQRTLHAVGFDLDSLAVTGSAPPCVPYLLSREPHALLAQGGGHA